MALTKLSTDSIDLSGNTTALTIPSGTTANINLDSVNWLVVAGGAGGGSNGGGGGAGGLRTSYGSTAPGTTGTIESPLSLTHSVAYTATVGEGGAALVMPGGYQLQGNAGTASSFSGSGITTITTDGGGGGASNNVAAANGGSGGGSGSPATTPGSGNTAQGNDGGTGGSAVHPYRGAGGGGADTAGSDYTSGNGGAGITVGITTGSDAYAGGGGGTGGTQGGAGGTGGLGGGGNGGIGSSGQAGTDGTANTGSGGGSSGDYGTTGAGGSGVIVLRYPSIFTATYSAGTGGAADAEVTDGTEKYLKITAGTGTVTFSNSATTSGRPTSPAEGLLRDNTDTSALEFYDGSLWQQIAGTLVADNAPSSNFNTVLYTGNRPSSQSITGVGFQPDLVWVKLRSASGYGAVLADSVAGAQKFLDSSNTNSQTNSATSLVSFDTDGFSVGGYGNWNGGLSGANGTMVSWNWKAGGSGSDDFYIDGTGYGTASAASLDGGTITPTGASINTATGFSIVKYTGNSTAGATVSHGLTVIPELVIIKRTDGTSNWIVGSSYLSGWNKILQLDLTDAETTYSGFYNTSPTDTVFYLGLQSAVNVGDYIAYCFHSVEDYSKIGSYTGNGLSTGNMVTTGFEPAWLMVKEISTSGGYWYIVDNKRNTSNPRNLNLFPNATDAEASYGSFDFLPTGFQPVNNWGDTNGAGQTYIYLAISS